MIKNAMFVNAQKSATNSSKSFIYLVHHGQEWGSTLTYTQCLMGYTIFMKVFIMVSHFITILFYKLTRIYPMPLRNFNSIGELNLNEAGAHITFIQRNKVNDQVLSMGLIKNKLFEIVRKFI
jgi:hypothetical protein